MQAPFSRIFFLEKLPPKTLEISQKKMGEKKLTRVSTLTMPFVIHKISHILASSCVRIRPLSIHMYTHTHTNTHTNTHFCHPQNVPHTCLLRTCTYTSPIHVYIYILHTHTHTHTHAHAQTHIRHHTYIYVCM